jgi:hypothetical protein
MIRMMFGMVEQMDSVNAIQCTSQAITNTGRVEQAERQEMRETMFKVAPGVAGSGKVEVRETGWRLRLPPATSKIYSNAQLDDYPGRPRRAFPWRPPVTLTIRARFSHDAAELRGTAGFGFWNSPYPTAGARLPALPRAAWFFFASPPSAMPLARGVPGHGWKAAVMDAQRPLFYALAPAAPLGFLLMRIPRLYRALWPLGQRALGVAEAEARVSMTDWHTYTLDWGVRQARFLVDDAEILRTDRSPRGPLGLVIWLDNQFAVVTPQGRFGGGLLTTAQEQWLEIEVR